MTFLVGIAQLHLYKQHYGQHLKGKRFTFMGTGNTFLGSFARAESKFTMTHCEAAKVKQTFVAYRLLPKTNGARIQYVNKDRGGSRHERTLALNYLERENPHIVEQW